MTIHARPDSPPSPTTAELLISAQRQHADTAGLLERLDRLERHRNTPAQRRTFTLTAAQPKRVDEVGGTDASYAVYNPSGATIYLGMGGDPAEPGRGAFEVPPRSMLVLPLSADDVELGVSPTDAGLGQGATFHVLRFPTVQAGVTAGQLGGALDVADRAARVLGRAAIVDQGSGAALAIDGTGAVDVRDRGGRLLGVLQGGLVDTAAAAGAVAAPAAGAVIAATGALAAGAYRITATSAVLAAAAADATNMELRHGATPVGRLLGPGTPTRRVLERITVAAGETVSVVAVAAGTAGTTYLADLAATRIA